MMERVRALRASADALHDAIADAVPQQYRERSARGDLRGDALGEAWLDAESDAFDSFVSLDTLLEHLTVKVASAGDNPGARASDILATLSDDEPEDPGEAAESQAAPAGPPESVPTAKEPSA